MRICMLNDNFYRGSGIAIAIRRLLICPAFADEDVYLVGCDALQGRSSDQDDLSFIDPSRYRSFALMQSGPGLFRALFEFGHWLRKMRFDLVHVHHRRLSVLAHLLTPITGVPVLFTGHLTFPEAAWFRELSPRRMTGVSPTVVAYLQRCTRARHIDLVYNAVPFEGERFTSASARSQVALMIARLEPVKGINILIDAYAKLRDRGIHRAIEIFGEGSLRSVLEKQIKSLALEDQIFLRGFHPDVGSRLRSCAFHVLCSEREGFPNVVVEAGALGIPTLLTDVDGSRDTLPAGLCLPNGVRFGDSEALADALAKWYAAPTAVDEDGCRFHDFLKTRCEPNIVAEGYRKVYASLVRAN
jgi:glycosyltransferase involved in cell wall biosynthesis